MFGLAKPSASLAWRTSG